MSVRFLHVAEFIQRVFPFVAGQYFITWMYYNLLIPQLMDIRLFPGLESSAYNLYKGPHVGYHMNKSVSFSWVNRSGPATCIVNVCL